MGRGRARGISEEFMPLIITKEKEILNQK